MDPPATARPSHAQAVVARITGVIVRLALEVPPLTDELTQAAQQLETTCRSLDRSDPGRHLPASAPDVAWPCQSRSSCPDDHPELAAWLDSPDTVTGEPDRRQLTVNQIFDRWQDLEPKPAASLARGQMSAVAPPQRGYVLLEQLAESLYLLQCEAPTWSPRTRARAIRLLRADLSALIAMYRNTS